MSPPQKKPSDRPHALPPNTYLLAAFNDLSPQSGIEDAVRVEEIETYRTLWTPEQPLPQKKVPLWLGRLGFADERRLQLTAEEAAQCVWALRRYNPLPPSYKIEPRLLPR